MIKTLVLMSFVAFAAVFGARAADDTKKAAPDRAKMVERHEQMAEMHRKAADCLKAGPGKPGACAFMGDGCPMCGPGKGMRMGRPGETKNDEPKKDAK